MELQLQLPLFLHLFRFPVKLACRIHQLFLLLLLLL